MIPFTANILNNKLLDPLLRITVVNMNKLVQMVAMNSLPLPRQDLHRTVANLTQTTVLTQQLLYQLGLISPELCLHQ